MTTREAAAFVSDIWFEIAPKSVRKWPLGWKLIHGRSRASSDAIAAYAELLIAQAAVVRRGPVQKR
jgi:hypothetical protein